MKKGICFLCTFFLIFPLSGCWDYTELNTVAIITGIAIDKGEKKKYKITVETLNPMELNPKQASGNTPSVIHSFEGNSISEIGQRMNIAFSEKAVFSHMRIAIIGEEVAENGMFDFFDYLERYREIREDFNVVIAKGVPASDILKISYPIQKASTLKLHSQLKQATNEWGSNPNTRKKDIIASWTSEGRQPVTAVVTIKGPPKKGNSVDNMKQLAPSTIVELLGMSVIKNQKLIGFLPIQDTRNYLWTQNKLKVTELTLPCAKNKFITIRVFRTNSKVKATYKNHTPYFTIHINAESQVTGTQCSQNWNEIKTHQQLEKKIEQYIEQEVASTIHKVQKKYKVDIFGFGDEMKHGDYQYFKKIKSNWDQKFRKATIDVKASVTLRRSGIRTKSFLSEIK